DLGLELRPRGAGGAAARRIRDAARDRAAEGARESAKRLSTRPHRLLERGLPVPPLGHGDGREGQYRDRGTDRRPEHRSGPRRDVRRAYQRWAWEVRLHPPAPEPARLESRHRDSEPTQPVVPE